VWPTLKLLVSVKNKLEAVEAIRGGAHIIDVKNPREGSLGANFPRVIRQVKQITPGQMEVSATIGDMPNLPGTASLAALGAVTSGAQYVKTGLFGVKTTEEAITLMKEVCRAVKDYDANAKVIAAGYADFQKVGCLNPLKLPEVACQSRADGVMVDTKVKTQSRLFDFLRDDQLTEFSQKAHKNNLFVALAGSLQKEHILRVFNLGADIIGVRGAVCNSHDRLNGSIQSQVVAEFAKVLSKCGELQYIKADLLEAIPK
jgi:uncharacterized protein (UPF0264 family)